MQRALRPGAVGARVLRRRAAPPPGVLPRPCPRRKTSCSTGRSARRAAHCAPPPTVRASAWRCGGRTPRGTGCTAPAAPERRDRSVRTAAIPRECATGHKDPAGAGEERPLDPGAAATSPVSSRSFARRAPSSHGCMNSSTALIPNAVTGSAKRASSLATIRSVGHMIIKPLPGDMRERSAAPVDWEVDAGSGALTADEQVEAERLVDVLAGQFPDGGYDVAVFVTDLPRRRETQPILAEVNRAERLALLSLPALGWFPAGESGSPRCGGSGHAGLRRDAAEIRAGVHRPPGRSRTAG